MSAAQCKKCLPHWGTCLLEKQRARVRFFLWLKGLSVKNIPQDMRPVHGEKGLSRQEVNNWAAKFVQGCSNCRDEQ